MTGNSSSFFVAKTTFLKILSKEMKNAVPQKCPQKLKCQECLL